LALEHYRRMNVKQVQNDTLSHLILSRASTFSLASIGDLTYPTECMESSQIYLSNCQEVRYLLGSLELASLVCSQTAEYVVRAFTAEKYSQVR
jgi:N-terminal acetyltransferase B complex non-catalytic subunit